MKLIDSFKNAGRGIWIAFKGQTNMKLHLLALILITITGLYLRFALSDWCIVVVMAGIVIGMEVLNTAIEEFVTFVSPEKRIEAGRIKDISAGAVLVVSIASLVVGVLLIYSKL